MDEEELLDLLEEIDFSRIFDKAGEFERLARQRFAPGEWGWAACLVRAADHHRQGGDTARARALLTEAGPGLPHELACDMRVIWLELEAVEDDPGAVDRRLDELRGAYRADELSTLDCLRIGGTLRAADDPTRALRWFTLGLGGVEPDDTDLTLDEEICLVQRHQVRRALGRGRDSLDRLAETLVDEDALGGP